MTEEDSSTHVKTIKNLKIKHTKRTRPHQALPSSISQNTTSYSQILRKAAEAGKHLSISLVAHAEAKVLFSTRSSPGRKVKSPLLGKNPGTLGGAIPREHAALLYSILLPRRSASSRDQEQQAKATTQFYRGTLQVRRHRGPLEETTQSFLLAYRHPACVESLDAFSKLRREKERERLKLPHLPAVTIINI